MGNISADQKLQLAQMIRAESKDNRMKMRSRERMLYGTDSKYEQEEELPLYTKGYYGVYKEHGNKKDKELYALESNRETEEKSFFFSFRLRLIVAVVLFAGFLFWDAGGSNIAGITTKQIKEEIGKDFDVGLDEVVFDFENNFPYTLFNGKNKNQ